MCRHGTWSWHSSSVIFTAPSAWHSAWHRVSGWFFSGATAILPILPMDEETEAQKHLGTGPCPEDSEQWGWAAHTSAPLFPASLTLFRLCFCLVHPLLCPVGLAQRPPGPWCRENATFKLDPGMSGPQAGGSHCLPVRRAGAARNRAASGASVCLGHRSPSRTVPGTGQARPPLVGTGHPDSVTGTPCWASRLVSEALWAAKPPGNGETCSHPAPAHL